MAEYTNEHLGSSDCSSVSIDCPSCGRQVEYVPGGSNYPCERCGVLWRRRMNDVKWTDERCAQLANLERVLREVASANSANNFIRRMAEASELAESLLNGSYPSFVLFLNGLAIDEREKQSKAKRLTQKEQDALGI